MILLVLAMFFVLAEAENWTLLKTGSDGRLEFDSATMALEFRITPKKTLENLDFNLVTKFFDLSGILKGATSLKFQMKKGKVLKSFLRLSNGRSGDQARCYDRKVLKEQVPETILLDLTDPGVFLIDNSKTTNFAENKGCSFWENMLAETNISGVEVALWDSNKNIRRHLDIEYKIVSTYIPPTTPELATSPITVPDIITTATTDVGIANLEVMMTEPPVPSSGEICSLYPQGVISTFNDQSEHYDLKCYHVVAASYGSSPWFVYGSFDTDHMLQALAVYVGSTAFEISRGWMLNQGGRKIPYREGEEVDIEGSGCILSLKNLDLSVDCRPGGRPFVLHYDGYSVAHIELFERHGSEIGLCIQNSSPHRRVNWQMSRGEDCLIKPDISDCEEAAPQCAEFETSCDESVVRACREMYCQGGEPTPEQICSLSQARKEKCNLVGSKQPGPLIGCPEDVCKRKYFILGAGCPQQPFFIDCPDEEYLEN